MDRDLVRIGGRSADLGRPFLYTTTKQFLQVFGLESLEQLPRVELCGRADLYWSESNRRLAGLDTEDQERVPCSARGEIYHAHVDAVRFGLGSAAAGRARGRMLRQRMAKEPRTLGDEYEFFDEEEDDELRRTTRTKKKKKTRTKKRRRRLRGGRSKKKRTTRKTKTSRTKTWEMKTIEDDEDEDSKKRTSKRRRGNSKKKKTSKKRTSKKRTSKTRTKTTPSGKKWRRRGRRWEEDNDDEDKEDERRTRKKKWA